MEFDAEGMRLPIEIDPASNGECAPCHLTHLEASANGHAGRLLLFGGADDQGSLSR
jgi:hypothetical protein